MPAVPPRIRRLGKVHHLAVVVESLDAAVGLWRDMLGLELESIMDIPTDKVRIAFLGVGESKVELVEPTDDTTGVARFLASKGEGFHHICFEVDNLSEAFDPPRARRSGADRHRAETRRGGTSGLHPSALLPGRPRRVDRGPRRAVLAQPRLRGALGA